ncbi:MAG TPA: extracellular solute-binding protein, partial [Clostridia bacterium]
MRKRIIKILTPAVLILFLFLSINCGKKNESSSSKGSSGGGQQVEIVFWHSFVSSTVPALNELISRFEHDHPNIRIHAQYIPTGDALVQKLITAIQSKSAPDISWIHSDFMEDLVKADAIYKMDYFIQGKNG